MADDLDPSTRSSDYNSQIAFWEKVEAILGGEASIKAGTTTYLPKFEKEKQATYDYRLANAPFTNLYADISKNLALKPFAKELAMKEGTPEQYLKLAENIDGQGNNQHVFAAHGYKAGQDKGIDWILVDYTKSRPRADGRPLSRAEESEQGLRPYWVHVPTERMVAVYSDFVQGQEIIVHARISESIKRREGFSETTITRIRVLDRVPVYDEVTKQVIRYEKATWELWEQKTNADTTTSWAKVDGGPITIGVIPLVPVVFGKRTGGSWIVEPPLRDLATMQITEYRQEASLEWVKIMTCFPMVCVSGMETKDAQGNAIEVTVGPNTVFLIPQNGQGTGAAGTVEIVEPAAQSIVENRNQLELTRKEMRDMGMQPMTEANLTVVTTANVSKKASSAVQAWTFLFKDSLEQAWKLTAMWLNDSSFEPEVIIHTDFSIELESGKELESLLKAEGQGIYSKKTVRGEFKRRNVVSNDIDDDEEDKRLAEQQEGLEPEEPIDPVTGAPIEPEIQEAA